MFGGHVLGKIQSNQTLTEVFSLPADLSALSFISISSKASGKNLLVDASLVPAESCG